MKFYSSNLIVPVEYHGFKLIPFKYGNLFKIGIYKGQNKIDSADGLFYMEALKLAQERVKKMIRDDT